MPALQQSLWADSAFMANHKARTTRGRHRVVWTGGRSAPGKPPVAHSLSERYGFALYDGDARIQSAGRESRSCGVSVLFATPE